MKDILQEQDYPLQVALSNCLPQVAAEMFSVKMIPESVKVDPTYNEVIGEYKAGIGMLRDVTALQTHWQLFLKILSNQDNSAVQGAACHLDIELRDRLKNLNTATTQNTCISPSIEADVIKTIELERAKVDDHDKAAKFLLKLGANTDDVALYEAAKKDDNDAAQFLLNLGASADIALLESAKVGHDKAAPFLLKLGANTNIALYEAAKGDDNDAAQLLLNLGASADIALLESAKVGHDKAAQFLLNLGASADIALLESAKVGHDKAAQFLLNLGASADITLLESAKVNHDKAGLFLIKFGANTDVALYETVKGDDNEATRFLFDLGANKDIALLESAKVGHDKAAEFLRNLGASADIALLESAKVNHDKAALFLVKFGANTNIALYEAARGDDNEIAKFLINLGAEKDIALLEAAKVGHDKPAQFLLKFEANTNVALYEAAKGDDYESAQFLINFGANTTISLLEAAKFGHDKAAQFLLKLRANTDVALFEAAKDDNEATQFLLNLGGSTDAGQHQLERVIMDILREQHCSLQVALKNILPQVAAEMFSIKMIPESVRDDPNYDKLIDEFKVGIKWQKDVPALQKYWQSFLNILYNQGGAGVQGAADYLDKELRKRLRNLKPAAVQSTYTSSTIEEDFKIIELDSEVIVLKQLQNLHRTFTGLMRRVRTELNEEIQNQKTKTCLSDIAGYVQDYISWESLDLSNISDLDGLFKELHRFYDFLDCDIIVAITEEYLTNSDLSKKLQNHSEEAIKFRNTQSVKSLRNGVTQIYNPHLKNPENAPKAVIYLKETWNDAIVEGLYSLIKRFFPKHEKQSLINHIEILAGSVRIKYIVRESQVDHLIAYAQGKLQFMRLIGMFSLVINDTSILADDDENENFTFDVALLEAAKVGHTEAVLFLLELGANVDTAFLKALQDDQNEAVSVLMELGGNIDDALLEAAKHGHSETVCLLLKYGASINHHNKEGKTPLMLATLGGHEQVVQTLVLAGADVYIQDNNNYTALTIACEMNSYTICNYQLQQRKVHETTFISACRHVCSNVICLLQCISSYITINSSDKIVADIQVLDQKFDSLVSNIKKRFSVLIKNGSCKLVTIAQHIEEYTEEKGLTKVTTIDELFNKIKSHYHFLSCHLIEHLVQCFLSGEVLQSRVKEYLDEVKVFEESARLIDIQNASDKIHLSKQDVSEPTCEIIIKLNVIWKQMTLKSLHILINHVFAEKGKHLNHIHIEHESLCITFRAPSSQYHTLKDMAVTKNDLLYQVGIFEMYIGNHPIIVEDSNDKFTFESSLLQAAKDGLIENVDLLLELCAHVHYKCTQKKTESINTNNVATALYIASQNGHYQVVELLLNQQADPNILNNNGVTALYIASKNGHYQVVELLLKQQANPNVQLPNGQTALYTASQNDHYHVVELLLNHEANPNIKEENDWTTLMIASQNGNYQVVELLLKQQADPNIPHKNGTTALYIASEKGHDHVVELLLKKQADPNIKDEEDWTALMISSQNGYYQVVELLLKQQADPNIKNKNGATALHVASENGHYQVVELLLNQKAEPNIQNNTGTTAVMIACQNYHSEVEELLQIQLLMMKKIGLH